MPEPEFGLDALPDPDTLDPPDPNDPDDPSPELAADGDPYGDPDRSE